MTGVARETSPELLRAREAYAQRAWDDAYQLFAAVDPGSPLGREDLVKYSWAAGLTGRDRELLSILERLYQMVLDDDPQLAARVGFWLGYRLTGLGGAPAPTRGKAVRDRGLPADPAVDAPAR